MDGYDFLEISIFFNEIVSIITTFAIFIFMGLVLHYCAVVHHMFAF